MTPGEISISAGPLLREKLKSGGANVGGAVVVLELTELDVVEEVDEEVAAVLEDVVVLEGVVALDDDAIVLLDVDVVLSEEVFCAPLG